MEEKEDPIAEGIKSGRIYGMKCEPLKDSLDNLKFCPNRDECETLCERLTWINEMEFLVRELHCNFCESDKWLFVGITEDGTMVTATTTEGYGKKLNTIIDEKRKQIRGKIVK